jgi:hypothetical protein
VTSSGTLTGSLATQSANTIWAGPASGAAANPGFRALTGADLPLPTSTSLGGVQSKAAVTSNWLRSLGTDGVLTASQPGFSDISGTATIAQGGTGGGTAAAARSNLGVRDVLAANRTYYVRTDGNNSNDGLANTSGGAFLTIQKAIDTAAGLDLSIYDVTIQVGNGTYTGQVVCKSYVGAGKITIIGDATTPLNVTISVTAPTDAAIMATSVRGIYAFKGVKIATVTSGHGIHALGSTVEIDSVEFGLSAGGYAQIYAEAFSRLVATGNYLVSGNAGFHIFARTSYVDTVGRTVTLTGTPAYSTAYAFVESAGVYQAYGMTFSGSATGSRYNVNLNGTVYIAGAGTSYFPGNAAGSTATGGQYA